VTKSIASSKYRNSEGAAAVCISYATRSSLSFFHGFHDIYARFTNNYHCILLFINPRRVL
ncbi:MAG: hypothetical protein WAL53_11410, partial [Nitrososphaeraceae archaeon]